MNYVVELHKTPTTLVRELFNFHNGSAYAADELWADGPPTVLSEGLFNTSQRMVVNDPEKGPMLPWAKISYNRIDIATLFSVVEIKLREVDIQADGSYDHALVLGEISRKYGLNVSEGSFVIKDVAGQSSLVATANNPAFIGSSPLVVELSLDSRVSLKVLNGFYVLLGPFGPGGTDIQFGDTELGYINTVPASNLITGTALANEIGLTAGSPIYENNETPWIKYTYEGKICFVAQKPIRHSVSYNHLLAANAAGDNNDIITIGEDVFRVRLVGGIGNPDGEFVRQSVDEPATHGSEWNQVMYRLVNYGTRTSEQPLEQWMNLSIDELPMTGFNLTEGNVNAIGDNCIIRGAPPRRSNDVGYGGWSTPSKAPIGHVWRPVLEIVDKAEIWMSADITRLRPDFVYPMGALSALSEGPGALGGPIATVGGLHAIQGQGYPAGTTIAVDDEGMPIPVISELPMVDAVINPDTSGFATPPTHDLFVDRPFVISYIYYQPEVDIAVTESVPFIPGIVSNAVSDEIQPSSTTTSSVYDKDAISAPCEPMVHSYTYQHEHVTLEPDVSKLVTQTSRVIPSCADFLQEVDSFKYSIHKG